MKVLSEVSSYIIPLFLLIAIFFACIKRNNPYSAFIDGARDGITSALGVLPYMIAIFFATELLSATGLAAIVGDFLDKVLSAIGIPNGLGLFLLLRPLSGSGALSELSRIFAQYGPDSTQGVFASVLMGSTETIFYTIPVYLSAANIKGSGKAVVISLVSMLVGIFTASLLVNAFWV